MKFYVRGHFYVGTDKYWSDRVYSFQFEIKGDQAEIELLMDNLNHPSSLKQKKNKLEAKLHDKYSEVINSFPEIYEVPSEFYQSCTYRTKSLRTAGKLFKEQRDIYEELAQEMKLSVIVGKDELIAEMSVGDFQEKSWALDREREQQVFG